MPQRTTTTTVTFQHPFALSALERPCPPGTYIVETDEEDIRGLSFLATRRTATMLRFPPISSAVGTTQLVPIDPDELAKALEWDRNRNRVAGSAPTERLGKG